MVLADSLSLSHCTSDFPGTCPLGPGISAQKVPRSQDRALEPRARARWTPSEGQASRQFGEEIKNLSLSAWLLLFVSKSERKQERKCRHTAPTFWEKQQRCIPGGSGANTAGLLQEVWFSLAGMTAQSLHSLWRLQCGLTLPASPPFATQARWASQAGGGVSGQVQPGTLPPMTAHTGARTLTCTRVHAHTGMLLPRASSSEVLRRVAKITEGQEGVGERRGKVKGGDEGAEAVWVGSHHVPSGEKSLLAGLVEQGWPWTLGTERPN